MIVSYYLTLPFGTFMIFHSNVKFQEITCFIIITKMNEHTDIQKYIHIIYTLNIIFGWLIFNK